MKTSLKALWEQMRGQATTTNEMWREYLAKQRTVCNALGIAETSAAPADETTTPTVAPADAFQTPGLDACPVLAEMIGKMAPVVEVVNDWAAEYSAALMGGGSRGRSRPPRPSAIPTINQTKKREL